MGLQVDVFIAAGKTECWIGSKSLPCQGLPTTTSNAIAKNDHKKKEDITKRRALSDRSTMYDDSVMLKPFVFYETGQCIDWYLFNFKLIY